MHTPDGNAWRTDPTDFENEPTTDDDEFDALDDEFNMWCAFSDADD
jgi:hypothetical protein